jgi:hypothetical protein
VRLHAIVRVPLNQLIGVSDHVSLEHPGHFRRLLVCLSPPDFPATLYLYQTV